MVYHQLLFAPIPGTVRVRLGAVQSDIGRSLNDKDERRVLHSIRRSQF